MGRILHRTDCVGDSVLDRQRGDFLRPLLLSRGASAGLRCRIQLPDVLPFRPLRDLVGAMDWGVEVGPRQPPAP